MSYNALWNHGAWRACDGQDRPQGFRGIGWNKVLEDNGGVIVGNEVGLELNAELSEKPVKIQSELRKRYCGFRTSMTTLLGGKVTLSAFSADAVVRGWQVLDVDLFGLAKVVVGVLGRTRHELRARNSVPCSAAVQRNLNRPSLRQVYVGETDVDVPGAVDGRAG